MFWQRRECRLPAFSHFLTLFLKSHLPGFCPEIKSTGTNGPLSLKKVGHFRKYGAQYDANSLSAFRQVVRLRNCYS